MSQNEAYYDTLALIEKGQWCFGSMDEENEERAIKAAKALALFARLNEQDCDGHPVSEIIVDFIANLMHLGEAINFRVLDEESAVIPLVRMAAVHFNAETKS
ncbi:MULTISPECIES: hypothetical protein [Enterobacterales]|jgi:hypothetical protein|uniref:Uncharacterized protein n=10 Tax=Enterobacterales TaxID=91347 RepID=A0A160HRQ7_ECOLX|nr:MULTISPECIES: hypothetical protein [Enterobacterales]EAA2408946.1 hypothetical protein [Shigella sonnei]EBR8810392.1 hypothetical protein [Salmonella enterica subsp. enterica serovar Java]ECA4279071.1 hypothetical protein [Salmonella enterica subsp. enterica serovar Enteritidis]ECG0904269.1 hypothetical protein [Salmonella enterica subsp. enterica]EDH9415314.1 hypothetical protein [Salmonella enterica subsp. enterica serovar Stanley]EDI0720906.1 hypothetical protein [Salmonella enterica su